ncbi:MAG: alpha-E domain-containing protein, partial [Gemmatimonadetes bacterium]|nr:alpha-E domain-containing protein [Gemmatimonadota bacterium]
MISRVAESCFWLHRHLERVDRTARNVDVNRAFVLDSQLEDTETWWPLLVVSGEGPRFLERFGPDAAADGEHVQAYLTWDRDNPVSILVATQWARENARTIRETVSREMWGCLNHFWLWLSEGPGKRVYARDRAEFFTQVRE